MKSMNLAVVIGIPGAAGATLVAEEQEPKSELEQKVRVETSIRKIVVPSPSALLASLKRTSDSRWKEVVVA
jgi:hypothetical protein